MSLFEVILLAIALGIDCFVVSFSHGICFESNRVKNSTALGLTMGGFQGGMAVLGYFGAASISKYVEGYSKWLVFAIFLVLGIKFIIDALKKDEEEGLCRIGFKSLMALGLATSIDAFAAGASLKFVGQPILIPFVIISLASLLMSLVGFWFGNSCKRFPSKYLEIFGGLILIGLAIKALI